MPAQSVLRGFCRWVISVKKCDACMAAGPWGHSYTGPYLTHWLAIGHANPWIHDAMDPPFASHRFTAFDTDLEAIQTLLRGVSVAMERKW